MNAKTAKRDKTPEPDKPPTAEELAAMLTPRQAGRLVGVASATVLRWARCCGMEHYVVGSRYRIPRRAVLAMVRVGQPRLPGAPTAATVETLRRHGIEVP